MFPDLALFGVHVQTYFLVICAGTLVATFWFLRRVETRGLNRVAAIDLTLVCLIGGFIGARLLHVFFEEPSWYAAAPLEVLEVWNGGFVYLGGVFFAVLAWAAFLRGESEPLFLWADIAAPPIAIGYAIGRVGCLFNGCCYGKFCSLPWSVYMHGGSRHPTQAYATLWELGVVGLLLYFEPKFKRVGLLFSAWLVLHGIGRILMEIYRDDPRGTLIYGMSLGIWMSLGLIGLGLAPFWQSKTA